MKRKLILMMLLVVLVNPITASANSKGLSNKQKKIADKVATTAMKEWNKYGVLPSVAVAQTFIESSLGVNQVRQNNLWGLKPKGKYASYSSLEKGIYAYLNVLNNGRYDKALYKKDYKKQIKKILQGGYYGEDDGGTKEKYYKNCVMSIQKI